MNERVEPFEPDELVPAVLAAVDDMLEELSDSRSRRAPAGASVRQSADWRRARTRAPNAEPHRQSRDAQNGTSRARGADTHTCRCSVRFSR
jgi:hypothetical protein